MQYVHLAMRFPRRLRHPMHAHLDAGDRRTEMLSWNLTDPETFAVLFRVHAPREPYLDALDDVETMDSHSVAPVDDESFYLHVHETPRGTDLDLRAAFAATDLVTVPPLVYESGGRLSMGVIGDGDDLRTALAAIPDAVDCEVSRVGRLRGGRRTAGAGLTDCQREALRAARRVGYYDVPRTGGVTDVAAALDCARSTASTHLRKAEAALVGAYLDS